MMKLTWKGLEFELKDDKIVRDVETVCDEQGNPLYQVETSIVSAYSLPEDDDDGDDLT